MKIAGRYELLDPIGHGGMAVVYLARQTNLDREVALKELRMFEAPGDPALAQRFLREARVAGSLSHPNVVTVHEYFVHEGTPYIAMEYLARGSLRPYVGHMSLAQVAGVLEGLLAALDHAESHHIVHRDLKPENLLITNQGQVKVADFGIAKARTGMVTNPFLTAAGTTVGTPAYMAPEQAMAKDLGPFTDLYSTGIMAYELLVGHVPFNDSDAPVAILLRHVNETIPSAHRVDPAVDPALSEWIDRLLVKDRATRTQSAAQAWLELEEIVLRLLGSRWRREARLAALSGRPPDERPLTPAPFTSSHVETPVPGAPSDEFASFTWGEVAPAAPLDPRIAPAEDLDEARPQAPSDGPEVARPQAQPEPAAGPRLAESEPGFVPSARSAPALEPPEPAEEPALGAARREPVGFDAPSAASEPSEPAMANVAARTGGAARTVMPESVFPRPRFPSPSTPARQIRRRRYVALLGGAAVVAVAVVAVVLGGGGSGGSSDRTRPASAGTSTLANNDLALEVPASWHKLEVPKATGLHALHAVAAGRPRGAYVAAELVRGKADPTLLPPKLLAALRGRRPTPENVQLAAGLQAYRYETLRPRGSKGRLRVYAVLTTEGIATVACGASVDGAAVGACDKIAPTLRLTSARGLTIGASEDYTAILDKTFATLRAGIRAANSRLAKSAATVTAQAAVQRQFAHVYEGAIASLHGGRLNVVDAALNAKLVSVFRTVASVYGHLERVVRRNDAAALSAAELARDRGEAKLHAAIQALRRAGYEPVRVATPRTTIKPAPAAEQSAPPPSRQATPPSRQATPPARQATPPAAKKRPRIGGGTDDG